LTITTLINPFL